MLCQKIVRNASRGVTLDFLPHLPHARRARVARSLPRGPYCLAEKPFGCVKSPPRSSGARKPRGRTPRTYQSSGVALLLKYLRECRLVRGETSGHCSPLEHPVAAAGHHTLKPTVLKKSDCRTLLFSLRSRLSFDRLARTCTSRNETENLLPTWLRVPDHGFGGK